MKRDTLLLITTSYPVSGDGSEAAGAFVADVAGALARHLPVRVVAPGAVARRDAVGGGVEVFRYRSPGRPLSLLSPRRPADWPAILGTLRSLRSQVLAADADGRVMHALALWVLPSGWAAARLARIAGVPYSVWALGSDIWTLGRLPGIRWYMGRLMRSATARYADGIQLAKDAEAIAGAPFEFLPSTREMHPTLPPRRTGDPPFRLMFLGRWHPNKGVDLLLESLALLGDADWARIEEIHIAGGGPLEGLVRMKVQALKDRGRPIRLSSFLSQEQAAESMLEADWLLIPSRIESIPVVFSDASKVRCPVITTPVGDLPALVTTTPNFGLVAEAVDPRAYASAISTALVDSPCAYWPGAERVARQFDLETLVCRILAAVHGSQEQSA